LPRTLRTAGQLGTNGPTHAEVFVSYEKGYPALLDTYADHLSAKFLTLSPNFVFNRST
jgi:hypothetical protein